MKRLSVFIFLLLFIVAFIFRLYKFDNPVADWHSWRQSDTSAVSRNFSNNGYDILRPRFDDLSNVPSGKNNLEGYRFVEFPIYNLLQAGFYDLFGIFSIEQWGRLVTAFSSLISAFFIFLLVKARSNNYLGFLSAFFYLFIPYNIYYGRVILPDPIMTMCFLGGIYFFGRWLSYEGSSNLKTVKRLSLFFISLFFCITALLLKPFSAFFMLPLLVLVFEKYKLSMFLKPQLWFFALSAISPLLIWRWWMLNFPEGIPVNEWLFNGGNIRFTGAFFYWIFADRISRLILGYFGISILFVGVIALFSRLFINKKRDLYFFGSFIISSIIYLFVVARGNVQHDYYQIPIVPSISILLGFGSYFLLRPTDMINRYISRIIFVVCVFGMLIFGWYHVRDYFNINNPSIIIAGEAVDKLTPKDSKILTFYDGDTTALYQTKRKGWSSLQSSIPELVDLGADYLLIINPSKQDIEGLGKEFSRVKLTNEYLLLNLRK